MLPSQTPFKILAGEPKIELIHLAKVDKLSKIESKIEKILVQQQQIFKIIQDLKQEQKNNKTCLHILFDLISEYTTLKGKSIYQQKEFCKIYADLSDKIAVIQLQIHHLQLQILNPSRPLEAKGPTQKAFIYPGRLKPSN
jgi:hypothetical protein